jgi:hypothetical protein
MQRHEHISPEDLLLFVDGELQERRKSELSHHLEACWECRTRMVNLQSTITDFVNAHHRRFERALRRGDGPRALLRARLRKMEASPTRKWPLLEAGRWTAILAGVAALVAVFVFSFRAANRSFAILEKPIPVLTPGQAVPVSLTQVCSPEFKGSNNAADLPYSLKKRVFDRYGMPHARFRNYEVDFLITPSLGGAASVKNLWPEPYGQTPWNAHVKDQLEVRLHSMVCRHEISLSAAQRDISTDWIRAYRKIFRTNRPLARPQPAALLFALLKLPKP